MVVLLHTRVMFPFSENWGAPLNLSEGVTFFFILSGFILSHAYPHLDEKGTRRFLVARIARLWPAHAVTTLVMVIPVVAGWWNRPSEHLLLAALADLALVHSWVPFPDSYFAFNSPSWSVSTEMAFYLLYPLLLWKWQRTWHVKLIIAMLLHLGLVRLSIDVLALPITALDRSSIDLAGMVNISPLATVYQFIIGMVAASFWRATMSGLRMRLAVATLLECSALGACIWLLAVVPVLPGLLVPLIPWVGGEWLIWVPPTPLSVFAFAALIVFGAIGRGLLSRLLSLAPFVLLGEISYSLYLIHMPVVYAYNTVGRVFLSRLPDPIEYALFWLGVLVSAWLLWRYVERPMREAIRAWYARHEDAYSDHAWRRMSVGIASLVLALLAVHVATLRE
jgi:peptidoglycan/LPS O-acetylase OafA/YrhL